MERPHSVSIVLATVPIVLSVISLLYSRHAVGLSEAVNRPLVDVSGAQWEVKDRQLMLNFALRKTGSVVAQDISLSGTTSVSTSPPTAGQKRGYISFQKSFATGVVIKLLGNDSRQFIIPLQVNFDPTSDDDIVVNVVTHYRAEGSGRLYDTSTCLTGNLKKGNGLHICEVLLK